MELVPSSGGVTLALHDLGGDGPPLLLSHATGFHGMVWKPLAAALPNRRCWALDFRGFGDSTPPDDGDFDWHGFADDVLAVIDHLGLTDVEAVGHSKGGAALLLAELARPGTFSRLFCFEPIIFPSDGRFSPSGSDVAEGETMLGTVTRHRRETFDSYDDAIARFASKPPLGSLRADALDLYVRHGFAEQPDGTIRLKADREHEAQVYDRATDHDTFERLGEVACPVLVVASGDGAGPALVAKPIAEELPHGSFLSMADIGHFGPLEDPDSVAREIHAWFG